MARRGHHKTKGIAHTIHAKPIRRSCGHSPETSPCADRNLFGRRGTVKLRYATVHGSESWLEDEAVLEFFESNAMYLNAFTQELYALHISSYEVYGDDYENLPDDFTQALEDLKQRGVEVVCFIWG